MATGVDSVFIDWTADDPSVTVTTKRGVRSFTQSDIPANVYNRPIDQVEAWCTSYLNNWAAGDQIWEVHIFELQPKLFLTVYGGDTPPPANWWNRTSS